MLALHGSGWHSRQFEQLGAGLTETGAASVIAPDLRGHGPAPARRGDIDYIGQMEDDIADLIRLTRGPNQKMILLGHSSGDGLAIRFAGGPHGRMLDAAILPAPFLQYDAPTQRPNSGGRAQVNLRRIIGLTMLNAVGIIGLNRVLK